MQTEIRKLSKQSYESVVSQTYKIFTVQSEAVVRQLFEEGSALADQDCSWPRDSYSLLVKSYEESRQKTLYRKPFFGWISFGSYPISIEDIFTEMFFAKTMTNLNVLRLVDVSDCYFLLELDISSSEAAVINTSASSHQNSLLLEALTVDRLNEFLIDTTHCIFPSIKISQVQSVSRFAHEGNLAEFEDDGRKFICRNFSPPKGIILTPEVINCESFYVPDSLSVWSINPIKKSELIYRKFVWPVGSSFNGLSVIEV